MDFSKSAKLFTEAKALIPGGVNSPVRAYKAVGGQPLFIERGEGPYLYDVDGNRYIDYVLSWGPLVMGHAYPAVTRRLKLAVEDGTSFGAPTALESELAKLIIDIVPSIEMIRFVNSGTEATMSALRLARAYTGRDKIIKFSGCYHGHADFLLVQAGSGVATLGLPDSPGVPRGVAKDTITVEFNDLQGVKEVFESFPGEIASVIVEPVAGNMGVVLPQEGFLEGLREITRKNGSVLIFDEVMTGFRVAPGGAQEYYSVIPDLTTLGKVIGGGLPVGAYGGKKEIMALVAPSGPMYQAGTLSGNPLAMTAGIETIKALRSPGVFGDMVQKTQQLVEGIGRAVKDAHIDIYQSHLGSMFSTFFTSTKVTDYKSAKTCDIKRFRQFFHSMIERGVYFAPSPFESAFTSAIHGDEQIEYTINAVQEAFQEME